MVWNLDDNLTDERVDATQSDFADDGFEVKVNMDDGAIACSRCGKPTSFDPIYGDLCYRCCRADNE